MWPCLVTEVRENEERTRRLIMKPEWQEKCASCKRRGAVPSSGLPLPILMPACSPKGPTTVQACRRIGGRNEGSGEEKAGEACHGMV